MRLERNCGLPVLVIGPSRKDWPLWMIVGDKPTYLASSALSLNLPGLKISAVNYLAITGPIPGWVSNTFILGAWRFLPNVSSSCWMVFLICVCMKCNSSRRISRLKRRVFERLIVLRSLTAFFDHDFSPAGSLRPCWSRKLLICCLTRVSRCLAQNQEIPAVVIL